MGFINGDGTITLTKVSIPDRNGLIRQDDTVCVCGHWGAVHRNGGKSTCEGRGCGCYTFRLVTREKAIGQMVGPKCPTCGGLLLGKILRVVSPTIFQTMYRHLVNDDVCVVEEMLPEVVEREKDIERQRERDSEWDDGNVGGEPLSAFEDPIDWSKLRGPKSEPKLEPEPEPLIGRARIALGEEV